LVQFGIEGQNLGSFLEKKVHTLKIKVIKLLKVLKVDLPFFYSEMKKKNQQDSANF
jgi:hypothetical protein